MSWRVYPDARYNPDTGHRYATSASMRLVMMFYEISRKLFTLLVVFGVAVAVGWWVSERSGKGDAFFAIVACGAALAISLVISRALRDEYVPLRCSGCRGRLRRVSRDVGDERLCVFYICEPCKKYLDAGTSDWNDG